MTVQGRPRWSIQSAQSPVVDRDGRTCTNMYETRNETKPPSGHLWREVGLDDLPFRPPQRGVESGCWHRQTTKHEILYPVALLELNIESCRG
jgi:hypothetical protein